MPRLLRKVKVDVNGCHAGHAKRRWVSPSVTSATSDAARPREPAAPPEPALPEVPRLLWKVKVDVSECHACHAKGKTDVAKCHACCVRRSGADGNLRHQSPPRAVSATPAMQSEGGCVSACHAKGPASLYAVNEDEPCCTVTQSGSKIKRTITRKTLRTTRKIPSHICVSPRKQQRSNSRTRAKQDQTKNQLPHDREGRDPSAI